MSRTLKAARFFPIRHFPLRVMRIPSHSDLALHTHEFYELVVILGGQGLHVTSTEEYPVGAGDVFLIRGDGAHGYAHTDRMLVVNILFDPVGLALPLGDLGRLPGYHVLFRVEPKLRTFHGFRGRLTLDAAQLTEAGQLIDRLERELTEGAPGHRFMARAHLMHLIGYLSRCYSETSVPAARPLLRIGELLSYMERHCTETVRMAALTRLAGMSESSLRRTFTSVMGRSPIEHLIRLRVARASEMLKHGEVRITEAAFQSGFSDANYFSRQFRRVTGLSPREYRRRLTGRPAA